MKSTLIAVMLAMLLAACSPPPPTKAPAPTAIVIRSATPIPSITPTPSNTSLPTPTRTPAGFDFAFFRGTTWKITCPDGEFKTKWVEFDKHGIVHYGGENLEKPPAAWWESDPNTWGFTNEALEIWWGKHTDSFPLSGFTQAPGNGAASAPGTTTLDCGEGFRIEQYERPY